MRLNCSVDPTLWSLRSLVVIFAGVATLLPAEAHAPGVVLTGFGSAIIDGQLGPGEWDPAAKVDFLANLPAADGGGTTAGTLYVMNDGSNLYLGVKVLRTQLNTGDLGFGLDQAAFEFDNNQRRPAGGRGRYSSPVTGLEYPGDQHVLR